MLYVCCSGYSAGTWVVRACCDRTQLIINTNLSLCLSLSVRLGQAQAIRQLLLFDVRRYFLLEHRAAACWSGAARTV